MMKQHHLSRTTIFGFVFGQGIMLGADARISSSYEDDVGNHINEEIRSDEEVKTFELCSNPRILCLLMGDVEEWHEMYKHMLQQAPKSVKEAFDVADDYLKTFKNVHRRNNRVEKTFGTVIGGYDKEEGFKVASISLKKKLISRKLDDAIVTLGSGDTFAGQILLTGQISAVMTREVAANLAFEALLWASLNDVYSGGKLTVTHVHEGGGTISETLHVLEVYSTLYDLRGDIEKRTMFLLYSTSCGPIYGDLAVQTLIHDVWPGLNSSNVTPTSYLIAKTACFYVHYIVFKTEQAATEAYVDVPTKNGNPHFPQPLAGIRSFLTNCVGERTRDHVYIGRSSKGLLEGLCTLQKAPNLKY